MKKLLKRTAGLIMAVALTVAALCGCGRNKPGTGNDAKSSEESILKITFMKDESVLGTAEVKEGAVLSKNDYEKYETGGDVEFMGWYETPAFLDASKKDLSKDTFTKDTVLYGNFKSNSVSEDTRIWYIDGTSDKGSLKESNWAGANVEDSVKSEFELKSTGNNNEFAITIDLYAGDQFQVIHDWSWDGQKGYGYFTGLDNAMFESGGGLGESNNTSNVNVIMDGNYTITLTTNPDDEAHDTITITRNGDIK